MHSTCKPRCLKEIVRIKRGRLHTISEAGIRISERDLLFCRCFPIDVPFSKIARQCSQACKEVGAEKCRAPASDHTVAEKMSHDGSVAGMTIRRIGFDCRNRHDIVPLIKIRVDESNEKHELGFRDDSSKQKPFYPMPVGAVGGGLRALEGSHSSFQYEDHSKRHYAFHANAVVGPVSSILCL